LRYWSLLTIEQRAVFLEERGAEIAEVAQEMGVELRQPPPQDERSVFTTFAGIYHAFMTLENALRKELAEERWSAVEYRLFGKKHDSLGSLLAKLDATTDSWARVERYVVVLCARQLVAQIGREFPDELASKHRKKLRDLNPTSGGPISIATSGSTPAASDSSVVRRGSMRVHGRRSRRHDLGRDCRPALGLWWAR
jgi:hypothetical protein